MLNKKLAVGVPLVKVNETGKNITTVANMWMHHVDYTFEQQWQDYKNMAIAWGRSNRNSNGKRFAA